jgi:hypothetical protein
LARVYKRAPVTLTSRMKATPSALSSPPNEAGMQLS